MGQQGARAGQPGKARRAVPANTLKQAVAERDAKRAPAFRDRIEAAETALADCGGILLETEQMIDRYNDEAPGHPVGEGLRSALRDRSARSVRVRFQAARDGYQPRPYRVEPENAPLPAALTGRFRSLAHAAINESLPRPRRRVSAACGASIRR